MTGPSDKGSLCAPVDSGSPPPKILLTEALIDSLPRSIETLGEAILNLSGQIDLPITLETSHYLFIRQSNHETFRQQQVFNK